MHALFDARIGESLVDVGLPSTFELVEPMVFTPSSGVLLRAARLADERVIIDATHIRIAIVTNSRTAT